MQTETDHRQTAPSLSSYHTIITSLLNYATVLQLITLLLIYVTYINVTH